MKPVFGIDVFASPFPTERGYSIYDGQNASLLLIKLEGIKECVDSAMKEFLGIDKLAIRNTNVAEGKEYRDVYKAFLETVRLPPDYLNRMYDSKFVQHFYGQDEISNFRKQWGKKRAKSPVAC